MTATASTLPTVEEIEHELARRDFIRWLGYVRIEEPPVQSAMATGVPSTGSIIPLELWPHLLDIAKLLTAHRLVSILKSRQVGVSWLLAAWVAWNILYRPGSVWFLMSKDEYAASQLLGKVKAIIGLLPPPLQAGYSTKPSLTEIRLLNNSRVKAFASTQDAGRSETASGVVQDEADYHEWLDSNYAAMKPTIDAGGQLIQASTVDKLKMNSLFKMLYRGAPTNGWVKYFCGWRARPGRTDEWYKKVRASVPTTQKLTADLYMEQEYPDSEAEALAPAQTVSAFEQGALKDMAAMVMEPLKGAMAEKSPQHSSLFQLFSPGRKYIIYTDTSHGVGLDYGVSVVLDVGSGAVVADILSNLLSPPELAFETYKLAEMYGNPLWGIEDNEWGVLTIETAKNLGYKRLFRDPEHDDRVGLRMDEGRYLIWGELIQAVKSRQITVFNRYGLEQFVTTIRNPQKGGRVEAMSGEHDDYPSAVAGAWYLRRYVHQTVGGSSGAVMPRRW